MPNYLVIRTSDDEKQWIWQEIQRGRLRQGWGLSNMELPSGEHTSEKMAEWCARFRKRGQEFWREEILQEYAEKRYWILRPMTEIRIGDRIVIPNMPTWDSLCVAIARGTYEFDNSPRHDPEVHPDDFRHNSSRDRTANHSSQGKR